MLAVGRKGASPANRWFVHSANLGALEFVGVHYSIHNYLLRSPLNPLRRFLGIVNVRMG